MKLNQKTEWIVVGVLIAYLAFTPGFQFVRDILSNPIGKAVFLGLVVYVWKYVSAITAVLLLVGYIRCARNNIWEGLAMPAVSCTCPTGFTYDTDMKKCKNDKNELRDPVACICPSGYSFDSVTKECVESSVMTEPIAPTDTTTSSPPPEPTPTTPETAAPAESDAPATSTAPATTPGAAQEAAAAAVATMDMAGVQPSASESFVGGYSRW
jgi:hypothetical protein